MVDKFTKFEACAVRLCGEGLRNDEIAARMHCSPEGVRAALQRAYGRLGVSGSTARTVAAVALFLAEHPTHTARLIEGGDVHD